MVYHPENGERSQLMLGDAYHWIGHIFEDRGELDRAWEAYNKSYQHYLLTREKFSPMINSLDGREHAKMHLWRIVEKDPSKKVIYGIRDVRQEQDVPENKSQAKQDYRNEIDVIIKRSNIPTPHVLCGLLVGK